jgi:hypothetical protein
MSIAFFPRGRLVYGGKKNEARGEGSSLAPTELKGKKSKKGKATATGDEPEEGIPEQQAPAFTAAPPLQTAAALTDILRKARDAVSDEDGSNPMRGIWTKFKAGGLSVGKPVVPDSLGPRAYRDIGFSNYHLVAAVRELLQNSLDAGARNVDIHMHRLQDEPTWLLAVTDDGGADQALSFAAFQNFVLNAGDSSKRAPGTDSVGGKGMARAFLASGQMIYFAGTGGLRALYGYGCSAYLDDAHEVVGPPSKEAGTPQAEAERSLLSQLAAAPRSPAGTLAAVFVPADERRPGQPWVLEEPDAAQVSRYLSLCAFEKGVAVRLEVDGAAPPLVSAVQLTLPKATDLGDVHLQATVYRGDTTQRSDLELAVRGGRGLLMYRALVGDNLAVVNPQHSRLVVDVTSNNPQRLPNNELFTLPRTRLQAEVSVDAILSFASRSWPERLSTAAYHEERVFTTDAGTDNLFDVLDAEGQAFLRELGGFMKDPDEAKTAQAQAASGSGAAATTAVSSAGRSQLRVLTSEDARPAAGVVPGGRAKGRNHRVPIEFRASADGRKVDPPASKALQALYLVARLALVGTARAVTTYCQYGNGFRQEAISRKVCFVTPTLKVMFTEKPKGPPPNPPPPPPPKPQVLDLSHKYFGIYKMEEHEIHINLFFIMDQAEDSTPAAVDMILDTILHECVHAFHSGEHDDFFWEAMYYVVKSEIYKGFVDKLRSKLKLNRPKKLEANANFVFKTLLKPQEKKPKNPKKNGSDDDEEDFDMDEQDDDEAEEEQEEKAAAASPAAAAQEAAAALAAAAQESAAAQAAAAQEASAAPAAAAEEAAAAQEAAAAPAAAAQEAAAAPAPAAAASEVIDLTDD